MENIDPVCGMSVENGNAAGRSEYEARYYYFCSSECKDSFDADPERYLEVYRIAAAGEGK
ncbi:MAG: YHS domain-containing protein [Pyrinomonadaceae bacterium]|nr:YHS domain-containing protein [Pyrinomonadaceae bacterium]